MKIKIPKLYYKLEEDSNLQQEIELLQNEISQRTDIITEGIINYVFINGSYNHYVKKMSMVGLLINSTGKTIKEFYGKLELNFKNLNGRIAASIINFDETFMGEIENQEALLFQIDIPVKGLERDTLIHHKDIEGNLKEVRVTYSVDGMMKS